jgi:hypothetical protein
MKVSLSGIRLAEDVEMQLRICFLDNAVGALYTSDGFIIAPVRALPMFGIEMRPSDPSYRMDCVDILVTSPRTPMPGLAESLVQCHHPRCRCRPPALRIGCPTAAKARPTAPADGESLEAAAACEGSGSRCRRRRRAREAAAAGNRRRPGARGVKEESVQ